MLIINIVNKSKKVMKNKTYIKNISNSLFIGVYNVFLYIFFFFFKIYNNQLVMSKKLVKNW